MNICIVYSILSMTLRLISYTRRLAKKSKFEIADKAGFLDETLNTSLIAFFIH